MARIHTDRCYRAARARRARVPNAAGIFVAGTVLFGSFGCTYHLDPPEKPPPVAAKLPAPAKPPRAGYGHVYLDVPEGPARVEAYRGKGTETIDMTFIVNGMPYSAPAEFEVDRFQQLCVTPCSMEMPLGGHEVRYTLLANEDRKDRSVLVAQATPTAYQHTVGYDDSGVRGSRVFSGVVLGLGVGVLATSPLVFLVEEDQIGKAMLIGGGAATLVGTALLLILAPRKQPGSTTTLPW